jgi:putative tricarboxylic transport membrane protein
MMRREKIALLLWLLFSIFVCIESCRLGLGGFHAPGPGFLTFGVALVIIILVIAHFLNERWRKVATNVEPLFRGRKLKNIIYVFIFLLAYPLLMDQIGFFLSTLLFTIGCLKVIGGKRWSSTIVISMCVAIMEYLVFDYWLVGEFPRGKLVDSLLSFEGTLWK